MKTTRYFGLLNLVKWIFPFQKLMKGVSFEYGMMWREMGGWVGTDTSNKENYENTF